MLFVAAGCLGYCRAGYLRLDNVVNSKENNKSPVSPKDLEQVEVLPAEESEVQPEPSGDSKDLDLDDVVELEPEVEDLPDLDEQTSNAVVTYDALRAYLAEVSQHPKLSKDEEYALAVRYKEFGDREAAYKLTVGNLWLVVALARRYQRAARSLLDLIQEGNIGLMEAVKNFDPYKEVRFPAYATWWIKAYIVRFVIANWRMVKLGTTQAQRKLFFNLEKEREKLERQGFVPTAKLLADNLNVKESEVVEMQQRLGGGDVSVDAPIAGESDGNLHGILSSGEPSLEDSLASKEIQERLKEAMAEFAATLNSKERSIYEKRLLAEEKATLQELALEYSISKERVRQIENRIKDRLKSYLAEKLGGGFLVDELGVEDSKAKK
jgi:RNA polymerase sigma-32 factor